MDVNDVAVELFARYMQASPAPSRSSELAQELAESAFSHAEIFMATLDKHQPPVKRAEILPIKF